MIVMKFGGTSVQDAAAISRVIDIVASKQERAPVAVVSAMARVTDSLLKIARVAKERRFHEAAADIAEIKQRHLTAARALIEGPALDDVSREITELISEMEMLIRSVAVLGELTHRTKDAVASFGERLSSLIIAGAFQARGIKSELVDSRSFIITDNRFTNASPDLPRIEERAPGILSPIIESGRVPVLQGFIGSTPDGVTTTIGRGGSDYTASLVGAALGAEAIEIWTDVDGLMTADPRVVNNAKRLRVISFAEAAELSYFGAKVLHPSTVMPAIERRIPVHIYNTFNPKCEGTLIVHETRESKNPIRSIALKREVTMLNITSTRMLEAHGFMRKIFEVFDRHETSVDVVTTSEVSVSVTLDNRERLDVIERDLNAFAAVTIEHGKAIICVVGDNLKFTPGIAARVFRAIESINVHMISQGASEINVTFVIDEQHVDRAVRALHDALFTEPDPDTFA